MSGSGKIRTESCPWSLFLPGRGSWPLDGESVANGWGSNCGTNPNDGQRLSFGFPAKDWQVVTIRIAKNTIRRILPRTQLAKVICWQKRTNKRQMCGRWYYHTFNCLHLIIFAHFLFPFRQIQLRLETMKLILIVTFVAVVAVANARWFSGNGELINHVINLSN